MTLRLQNMMLAMLLALTTLFVGFGTLSQNPTSGGYQLFERAASGISADIQLASLENFAPPPETASEYAKAPNRTVTFTETGAETQLRRTVDVDGHTVQINSGHAYSRSHSGGDVRDSGLSMDQIDSAIVNDIADNVNVSSLPRVPQMTSNTININGYSLTYDVTRLPNGNVSVSTYYPGH